MDPRPIGVFDSGVGGLTVFHALERALPGESLVYLGDTARVPYGTKSAETVVRYALEAARFLLRQRGQDAGRRLQHRLVGGDRGGGREARRARARRDPARRAPGGRSCPTRAASA